MRPTTTVIFITKSVPQPFEHKELCKSTLSLDSTSSRKDCPRHCQSLAGMEDVDSEKQKPLPFHFQTPCLQFTKDESKARIRWLVKACYPLTHGRNLLRNKTGQASVVLMYFYFFGESPFPYPFPYPYPYMSVSDPYVCIRIYLYP